METQMDRRDCDGGLSASTTSEESDSQAEWPVKRILAQKEIEGQTRYLIEWEGYRLGDATWEPAENLTKGLLHDWRALVRKSGRTTVSDFDLGTWRSAAIDVIRAKYEELESKNKKRERSGQRPRPLGCSLQEWINSIPHVPEDAVIEAGDSNECHWNSGEDDNTSLDNSDLLGRTKASIATAQDTEAVSMHATCSSAAEISEYSSHEEPRELQVVASQSKDAAVQSQTERDGSVRLNTAKVSGLPSAPSNRPVPSKSKHVTRNIIDTAQEHAKLVTSAKRRNISTSRHKTSAKTSTTNVFIGGKTWKRRRTLLDAASDASQEPQLFNHRKRRLLEKASRDKEGITPPNRLHPLMQLQPISKSVKFAAECSEEDKLYVKGQSTHAVSSSASPRVPKSRKRVHWADSENDSRDLSKEDSESLFVADQEEDHVLEQNILPFSDLATADHGPLGTHCDANSQTPGKVVKRCHFGSSGKAFTELEFSGCKSKEQFPWTAKFEKISRLTFAHICSTHDLVSQSGKGTLRQVGVCQGNVLAAAADTTLLCQIEERLRLGHMAATCHLEEFSVAIFAPEISTRSVVATCGNDDASGLSTLTYAILLGHGYQRSMLSPEHVICREEQKLNAFNSFSGGLFNKLFNKNRDIGTLQHFFFIFPPNVCQEAKMITDCLRRANPEYKVGCSVFPGQWSKFLLHARHARGTIILHEDAVLTVRSIPNFADVLHERSAKTDFWLFTQSRELKKGPDSDEDDEDYQDYQLQRMYQPGIVLLLTPSFLVSQPEQAYNFVKFFWQNYTPRSKTYRLGKLAFCCGIQKWLLDLAIEKGESVKTQSHSGIGERQGVSATGALLKCLNLLRKLEGTDDPVDGPFIYAPEMIDGNDEQSLVNWFGFWTLLHNRHFRRFVVLGSSNESADRRSRSIRPVQLIRSHDQEMPAKASSSIQKSSHLAMGSLLSKIRHHLDAVEAASEALDFSPLVFYRYAVSNRIDDVTSLLGHSKSMVRSYENWKSVSQRLIRGHKNTFIGLFLTFDSFDSRAENIDSPMDKWSPWVAIYRPVELFVKPWQTMELFIWDPSRCRRTAIPDKVFRETLTAPQKELLDFLIDKKSDLPFERAWLGPFDDDEHESVSNPVDRALAWLEQLAGQVRWALPLRTQQIPMRGWKPVRNVNQRSESLAGPEPGRHRPLPLRTILAAPPSLGNEEQPTTNTNYFQEAIENHSGQDAIPFTFKPTKQWYTQQLKDGRGFHHVDVLEWQTVFARYRGLDVEKDA